MNDPVPFPAEAFERLRLFAVGQFDYLFDYQAITKDRLLEHLHADRQDLADWALAAVPRMRERERKILAWHDKLLARGGGPVWLDDFPWDECKANLADLGVMP
jgi:hypothetical protein